MAILKERSGMGSTPARVTAGTSTRIPSTGDSGRDEEDLLDLAENRSRDAASAARFDAGALAGLTALSAGLVALIFVVF